MRLVMNTRQKARIKVKTVIRIGGSVVASPLNPQLISEYVELLRKLKTRGHAVATVVGGGTVARDFIEAAKTAGLSEKEQDEVAISASRLVAEVFVKALGGEGCGVVPKTVEAAAACFARGRIVVMGGLKPGMTTDAVAALVAQRISAGLLVKATNQDGVYERDPRRFPGARKIDRLTFRELGAVLAEKTHRVGMHQIVDPEAVKILQRSHVRMVVVNGFMPENVLRAVEGAAVGTLIE